jgi:glutamine synthetase
LQNVARSTALTYHDAQVNNYTTLDQKGIVIAEYVWIDAEGNTRSKTRVRSTRP